MTEFAARPGVNPRDTAFRRQLLDILDGQPAPLDPHDLIGRRVRVLDQALGGSVLGRVEALQMRMSEQAVHHIFANLPGDVKSTRVEVKLDSGHIRHYDISQVEFVEENFSDPAKGGQDAEEEDRGS